MIDREFDDAIAATEREHIARILDGFDLGTPLAGRIEVLAGGASNANYVLTEPSGDRFVLRVASPTGERLGVDRWRGVAAHETAAAAGLAPEIRAVTLPAGHLLTRFADGPVLDADRIRTAGMLGRVGGTIRAFHAAGAIRGRFSVFDDQRRYTALARGEGLALPADIDGLNRVAHAAEAVFAAAGVPDRLCHNDLQLPNFIIQPERLVVLDWEFAGMGNPYFDLGATGVNADLDGEEVRALVAAYFGADAPAHRARVELMMFMSALREATWAVVAAPALTLDWDYDAWAAAYYGRCRTSIESGRIAAAMTAAAGPAAGH